eukprot:CAMPEP_0171057236 /NCGR_PEP_ID=MMETSP0766_2-20121228/1640_1 /TAXON_ID=439317 /ORGANISM="Gambierdiscus australes, Strain CAWD 149" /LENGTH=55 /DNA_ID=CAMNT_0011512295 /DNA_START=368 /DNA_END=535 /DNA_ORIENTATION=-
MTSVEGNGNARAGRKDGEAGKDEVGNDELRKLAVEELADECELGINDWQQIAADP